MHSHPPVAPGRLKRRTLFAVMKARFRSGWSWAPPEQQAVLDCFRRDPEFFRRGEIIWETRHKKVYKLTLPPEFGGRCVVFKEYWGFKKFRYLLRCSKTALEAANYVVFTALGLPMAKLLFCRDERRCFRLERSGIATEFAEGCRDGSAFMTELKSSGSPLLPGNDLVGSPEAKLFLRKNLALLARIHRIHCYHKAAKPYNFLWRPRPDGDLEVVWIDVASCRFLTVPELFFRPCLVYDLYCLCGAMGFSDDELLPELITYCRLNPRCRLAPAELLKRIRDCRD